MEAAKEWNAEEWAAYEEFASAKGDRIYNIFQAAARFVMQEHF